MPLEKPPSVAGNPVKSQKWDEITNGRTFQESDIPTLTLLCQWHLVAEKCIDDLDDVGNQLIYENSMHDIKPMPQLDIMKKASAEIRQLNKQLGINDEAKPDKRPEVRVIHAFQQNRKSRAANSNRAKAG